MDYRFLNEKGACVFLNIDKSTLRKWSLENEDFPLPCQPPNARSVRYCPDELGAWMKKYRKGVPVAAAAAANAA